MRGCQRHRRALRDTRICVSEGPEKAGKGPREYLRRSDLRRGSLQNLTFAGLSRWRDPDSNRGHHDFQSWTGIALTRAESLQLSGFSRAVAADPMFANCVLFSPIWALRGGSVPNGPTRGARTTRGYFSKLGGGGYGLPQRSAQAQPAERGGARAGDRRLWAGRRRRLPGRLLRWPPVEHGAPCQRRLGHTAMHPTSGRGSIRIRRVWPIGQHSRLDRFRDDEKVGRDGRTSEND
jgi:hypothetical protein